MSGRGERIRTSGLYVPNVALYQAKLHPEVEPEIVANLRMGLAAWSPKSAVIIRKGAVNCAVLG